MKTCFWMLGLFGLLGATGAAAQETPTDYAWRPLLVHAGVDFSYIYYTEAGANADGVVIKLVNRNDYPIRYRFKVVFRTDGEERLEEAEGRLGPREVKTGDMEGLYWMPFRDGRPIIEFGLRGYDIQRIPEGPSSR